jgi:hypothetical protein
MKYFIIVSVSVIIIYLIYDFRYYLKYFFSLLSVTNKNNRSINNLKKQGLNKRKVSNEDINKYIEFAKEKLIEKSIGSFGEFKVDQELERHLKYSRFSEKYLEELFCKILNHLNIKREELDFEIEYLSSKKSYGYAGMYYEKGNKPKAKVYICVRNDMIYETVISTLAHECCHHLLLSNDIRLKERVENECLTDITAILTGFGKFMVKGYEISNRVIYAEEFLRLVDKDRVGYLSSKDIKYTMKKYIKY